jgi:hypothetical protein
MDSSVYSSNATNKSARKRKKNPVSQLALDSFEAFKPFINIFDPGTKDWAGTVVHTITREDWRLFRRYKDGERNLTYLDGREFKPGRDIVQNIYGPRHVHRHIDGGEVSYYTSGKNGLALAYLDIDAHHPWQTDEYRAKAVLEELFPFGYFRCSRRGQNGYLKIRYNTPEEFNDLADRLEKTLARLFLSRGILCDIEIKGTITTGQKSGSLAKPPFTTNYPCHRRDETDSWNYPQLEKFKACPVVNLRRIECIIGQIEIDEEKAAAFAKVKKRLDEEHKVRTAKPAPSPPSPTILKPVVKNQPKPSLTQCSLRLKMDLSPQGSDDAFRRNLEDIRLFARAFFSEHRRFPTTEEALEWLRDNKRYSGEWEDNVNRRAKRVEQILQFTERTFDPDLLAKGENPSVSLELGRFSWWVRQKCGSTMIRQVADISRFDAETMQAPTTTISVPAKFVETFLTVAHFCLSTDPLSNRAVPTNRIKKIWGMVKDGAAWNQKYFQVVRDRLNRMGIISIFDRQHHAGKAWRWSVGNSFPEHSWKEDQRKLKEELRLPAELAKSFEEIVAVDSDNDNNNLHNTLYHDEAQISAVSEPDEQVRPPP